MECWICEHGTQTNAVRVGVCIVCSICACDEHGDRPTKDRFWCFICLQRIALNAAGFPVMEDEEATPDDTLSDDEVNKLWNRLQEQREVFADLLDQIGHVDAGVRPMRQDVAERAFEIAVALAVLSAGIEALRYTSLMERPDVPVVDRRLLDQIRT